MKTKIIAGGVGFVLAMGIFFGYQYFTESRNSVAENAGFDFNDPATQKQWAEAQKEAEEIRDKMWGKSKINNGH